ncbi:hypothetical protein ACFX19_020149 [Malus domestica]
MDSSNLTSLPEDPLEDNQQQTPPQPRPLPAFASPRPDRPPTQTSSEKYSALDWTEYFDKEDDISIPESNDIFHLYTAGTDGPVVFCLHGGGYSGYV